MSRRFFSPALFEAARLLMLTAVAGWVLRPFFTGNQIGSGDALWYANMLADYVSQVRAGGFPVFVGQTDFAFNGAVYPLRVAPLYQHLAGLIDLVTLHRYGWFALQHACVLVMGFAGVFTSYWTIRAISRGAAGTTDHGSQTTEPQAWCAALLAVLYITCPGVLGTVYTQDLYMTWMTVPFLPIAVYGSVRCWMRGDLAGMLWLAGGLAALWWGHSPVALWATLLLGAAQVLRLALAIRDTRYAIRGSEDASRVTHTALRNAAIGAAVFAALAHYPFLSVKLLDLGGAGSAITASLGGQEVRSNAIKDVFPAVLKSVSEHARALSDLQLGWGLWMIFLVGAVLVAARLVRGRRQAAPLHGEPGYPLPATGYAAASLIAAAAVLLLLLTPVPWLNDFLWNHLPEQLKRITYYWPMHRFYLIAAALIAPAGALALAATGRKVVPIAALALCAAWSATEARQFVRAGADRTSSAADSARRMRPENRLLMNHSFGLFKGLPRYFSNGVMDARALMSVGATKIGMAEPPMAPLRGTIDANPGVVVYQPTLALEPAKRYALKLQRKEGSLSFAGVLQIAGRNFFREYQLPESGERDAFSVEPGRNNRITLFTSGAEADTVSIRFIPTAAGESASSYLDFGQFDFREIDPKEESVAVTDIFPLRAEVRRSGRLETPRMYIPGYVAQVYTSGPDWQSAQVVPTSDGRVSIETPAPAEVILSYRAPGLLQASYWFSLAAWAGAAALAVRAVVKRS